MKVYLVIGFIMAVMNTVLVLKHNENGANEMYFGTKCSLFSVMLAGVVYVFVWPLCLLANVLFFCYLEKSMKPKKKFLVFRNTQTGEKVQIGYDDASKEALDQYWLDADWVIDEYQEN